VQLSSKAGFAELAEQQGGFPSKKFLWCANFLKALPLLEWLDSACIDPSAESTILLARRRSAAASQFNLSEHIAESEHYGDRHVWHPLYKHSDTDMQALARKSGLPILEHRSLECDPCVNAYEADILRMDLPILERTKNLEQKLDQKMFASEVYGGAANIIRARELLEKNKRRTDKNYYELFTQGCGASFGCGL